MVDGPRATTPLIDLARGHTGRVAPDDVPSSLPAPALVTRADVTRDARALGIGPGDVVMVHAAVSAVGPLLNGPDAVIGGLLDAVSPGGTLLAYTDWDARHDELVDESGRVPDAWRRHVPPFDPRTSRSIRDHGVLPEFLRTWPEAVRSGNPGASVAALGAEARRFTDDHPLDYGYGTDSPLARLVEARGKVLMLGAPWDTMTLVHHAEHLADVPDKRVVRFETPFATASGTEWRTQEEFDTCDPVVEGLAPDFIGRVVADFVQAEDSVGHRAEGLVGAAPSLLVDAAPMCRFAVRWLEARVADHRERAVERTS